jgi:hypothetical protein
MWKATLGACLLGGVGTIALISDLAQIESLATAGGAPVVRVAALLFFLIALAVTVTEKFRKGPRTTTAGVVLVLCITAFAMSYLLPPASGNTQGDGRPVTTQPSPSTTTPPESLDAELDSNSKPPQRSFDLDTLNLIDGKDENRDFTIECRNVMDTRLGCPKGGRIIYYIEPHNADFAKSTTMDPHACPTSGYSNMQASIQLAQAYCVRTATTTAVIRIRSAPETRPDNPSTVALKIEAVRSQRR